MKAKCFTPVIALSVSADSCYIGKDSAAVQEECKSKSTRCSVTVIEKGTANYSGLPCHVLKYYSRDDTLEKTYGCESDEVKEWIGSDGDCKDATGVFGPGKDAGEGSRVTICSCGGNYCNKVTTMSSPEPALFSYAGSPSEVNN